MFEGFRRRKKTLLAATTLLAMFAFVFLPGIGTGVSRQDPRQKELDKVVTTINGRPVTLEMLISARRDKQLANSFVVESMLEVGNFNILNIQRRMLDEVLGFGSTETDEDIEDSIRMANRADEYGIKVTDEMVRDFIRSRTGGQLSTEQYRAVVGRLRQFASGLTGDSLFEILRRQIRLRRVAELATGRLGGGSTQVTPYEAWQFYRKTHDRVTLDAIPVRVASFTSEVGDPGDATLGQLFDKYRGRLADPSSPEPGFKEPRKVQLQFASMSLEALLLAMRDEIQIGEDEMKQYYESHKYQYMILPSKLDDVVELPEKPKMDEQEPSEPKSDGATKEKTDDAKPDSRPEGDAKKADGPNKPTPDAVPCLSDDEKSPEKSAAKSGEAQSSSEKVQPAAKTHLESSDGAKAGDEKNQSAEKPEATPPSQEPDAKPADKSADEPAKKDEIGQDDEKKDEPKYKPFDDVKQEIADRLSRQKARDELLKRMKKVHAIVNRFADDTLIPLKMEFDKKADPKKKLVFTPPDPPNFGKEIEALGMRFVQTQLIAFDEQLPKKAGIGDAGELMGDAPSRRSVLDILSRPDDLYEPFDLANSQEEFFTIWKVRDVPEGEPSFDAARDKVLAAFRTIKARDLARAQAEKIAESLRAAGANTAKLIEREPDLRLIHVPSVPIWSDTSMFGSNRVEPSVLGEIEQPGDTLRDAVFRMKEADVTVAPNQPEGTYYVIVVTQREPAQLTSFARSRTLVETQVRNQLGHKQFSRWINDLREESSRGKVKAPAGN